MSWCAALEMLKQVRHLYFSVSILISSNYEIFHKVQMLLFIFESLNTICHWWPFRDSFIRKIFTCWFASHTRKILLILATATHGKKWKRQNKHGKSQQCWDKTSSQRRFTLITSTAAFPLKRWAGTPISESDHSSRHTARSIQTVHL